MLGRKVVRDDVTVAVMAGQEQVRTLAFKMPGEQQFGVGNADRIRMGRISVNDGRTTAVTTRRRRRVSH